MASRNKSASKKPNNIFDNLKPFRALTENQAVVQNAFSEKDVCCIGYAGTGKTFISLALSLQALASGEFEKIVIVRTCVPTRDIGFMPGDEAEKLSVYEKPYIAQVNQILGRGDAYYILKEKGLLEFSSSSFLRGLTIDNAIIIFDEMQNSTIHELNSIVTRRGKNCKLVLLGDGRQTDFVKESSSLEIAMKVLTRMKNHVTIVEMGINDIVRDKFVKDWIINLEAVMKGNEK